MSENSNKPNVLFWIIGIVALLWNAMGVKAYLDQAYQTDAFKEMYKDSPELLEIVNNLPSWYTALFAIAVFGSTLACILLLLRKNLAKLLFFLSLIAVIVQTGYNLFMNDGKEHYDAFQYSMLILIPVIAVFLYLYSKSASRKGWLS
ncbi:hypothetical protein AAON49_07640 [Pseudotenacibaculum sp. MALMAid0570]|uniref:hypothetical protein n=1 Tax=Pseudotenacibaculum sp. MALMAid0570 TaxID=3143938 RepID=UPI0032DFFBE7